MSGAATPLPIRSAGGGGSEPQQRAQVAKHTDAYDRWTHRRRAFSITDRREDGGIIAGQARMLRPLPRKFYDRPALVVARELLGARLVRVHKGVRLEGCITETEAYVGEADLACHARAGRTPRTAVMYGSPGHAYVYFTYGMHWLLNAVTGREGFPAAVLIRSIRPERGAETMTARRKGRGFDGPAKLTQALGIDGKDNGIDLTRRESGLWIEAGSPVPRGRVKVGPRVGLNGVPEPWKSKPWRFVAQEAGRAEPAASSRRSVRTDGRNRPRRRRMTDGGRETG